MPPPYGTGPKPPGPQQINNGINIVGNGNGNQNAGQQSNNQYSPTNQQFLENNINMNYINTTKSYVLLQKTLKKKIHFSGVGVHNGRAVSMCIKPAEPDTGIVFKRTDLKEKNIIKACYKNVSSTNLCTTIRNQNDNEVQTVEHLIAAFYLTGLDNVIVEIDNVEVPIMDGSSKEFISIINKVGLKKQNSQRKFLKINEKINYTSGEKSISISPNDKCLEINFFFLCVFK